jgi:biopolymer transport protein ExbD
MAGVTTETEPRAGRRALDSEINMIPMIDLLVCCISFLLITAVWSQMARIPLPAADMPGGQDGPLRTEVDRALHVEIRSPESFGLVWRQGATVIRSTEVPRRPVEAEVSGVRVVRYPDLAERVQEEWRSNGAHRDYADPKFDRAVLHSQNQEVFGDLVAVLDAVHSVHRAAGSSIGEPAFAVTFATAE